MFNLQASHDHTFALKLLVPLLLLVLLPVNLEADSPAFFQVQQLLEQLLDVVVGLGRGLHEGTFPLLGHGLSITGLHLTVLSLITLVPNQHDRDARHVPFDLADLFKYWL